MPSPIFWLSHIDVTNSGIIAGVGLVFPVGMGLFAIANGIQIGMGSLLSRAIGMQRLIVHSGFCRSVSSSRYSLRS